MLDGEAEETVFVRNFNKYNFIAVILSRFMKVNEVDTVESRPPSQHYNWKIQKNEYFQKAVGHCGRFNKTDLTWSRSFVAGFTPYLYINIIMKLNVIVLGVSE